MRNLPWFRLFAMLLLLAACSATRPPPDNTVVIRYQHVANVHQIRFATPLALTPSPARYVMPRDARGFWAIFVLCSLDATAKGVPSFVYDVNNFRVAYNGRQYGLLMPYTLRHEDTIHLNKPAETAMIANAIGAELQEGPSVQVFGHGLYPSLNYRIALFVPRGLDEYAGEPLTLSYLGQPSLVLGNRYPPYDIAAVGGSGAGVAASCLP